MRRVFRRAFGLTALVSALLCVGVCAIWVRSYWVGDVVGYETERPVPQPAGRNYFSYQVETGRGGIRYMVREGVFGMPLDVLQAKQAALANGPVWSYRQIPHPEYPRCKADSPPSLRNRLGIYYESFWFGHQATVDGVTAVTVPLWCIAAALALLAASTLWLVRRVRQ